MTPEDFRNIVQGLQAIFLTVAAVIGGSWVLLRFGLTRERARAQLELEKNRAEVQRLRGVSCAMSVRHAQVDGSRFSVLVDATLTNHGTAVRLFRTDDYPFHINRVTIVGGDTWYDEVVRLRIEDASPNRAVQVEWPVALFVLPDTPHRLSFCYELDAPGTYMFSLVFGSDKVMGTSKEDRTSLAKGYDIYLEYKSHPNYTPDPKQTVVFNTHHHVFATSSPTGPNTRAVSAPSA